MATKDSAAWGIERGESSIRRKARRAAGRAGKAERAAGQHAWGASTRPRPAGLESHRGGWDAVCGPCPRLPLSGTQLPHFQVCREGLAERDGGRSPSGESGLLMSPCL